MEMAHRAEVFACINETHSRIQYIYSTVNRLKCLIPSGDLPVTAEDRTALGASILPQREPAGRVMQYLVEVFLATTTRATEIGDAIEA